MTGTFPKKAIDHRDGDRTNNRFSNLREATMAQNAGNSKKSKNNISGFKGVSWHREQGKWRAEISCQNKRYWLGFFTSALEAHQAYAEASRRLFGDFARPI